MPAEIVDASGKLLVVRIAGMFAKADYDRIIRVSKEAIAREGKIRTLIVAEDFQGWERDEDWGDVSFITEEGQQVEKMALVGDPAWRDEALAFTAQGFRPTAVEFFPASRMTDARRWLSA